MDNKAKEQLEQVSRPYLEFQPLHPRYFLHKKKKKLYIWFNKHLPRDSAYTTKDTNSFKLKYFSKSFIWKLKRKRTA